MSVLQYNYINKNQFSRPGYKLLRVSKIVMHYTANPGQAQIITDDILEI